MPSRRSLRLALAAPAVALFLGAMPSAASAITGAQEIAFLNAQRTANGLPGDITENADWSAGCAAHMNYLAVNNLSLRHDEGDPNDVNPAHHLPGWSLAGRDAGASSVLTSGGASFSDTGVNAFEHAPIHLAQMLSPFLKTSGSANGCLATLRDTSRSFPVATTFSYPGDGAINVPTSETSFEGPFVPAAFVGLGGPNVYTSAITGPSLYFFNANAGDNKSFASKGHITSATLTGPSGAVDVRTVDNYTTADVDNNGTIDNLGQYLPAGGILIPAAPLQKDAKYTATVTFSPDDAAPIARTWSFVTGVLAPAPPVAPTPTPTPAPATTPVGSAAAETDGPTIVVSAVALRTRSVSFKTSAVTQVWVTIELRKAAKGKSKASYVLRRSFAVSSKAKSTTKAKVKKLAKGKYRVRLRGGSITGDVLAERTLTVR